MRKVVLPVLAVLMGAAAAIVLAQVSTKELQSTITPAEALKRLQEGNARFAAGQPKTRDWAAKVIATASGQYPFAAVVSCIDSRAPAEIAGLTMIRSAPTGGTRACPPCGTMVTGTMGTPAAPSSAR